MEEKKREEGETQKSVAWNFSYPQFAWHQVQVACVTQMCWFAKAKLCNVFIGPLKRKNNQEIKYCLKTKMSDVIWVVMKTRGEQACATRLAGLYEFSVTPPFSPSNIPLMFLSLFFVVHYCMPQGKTCRKEGRPGLKDFSPALSLVSL